MSATAEQAGGAVGIAALYAIFHTVDVQRLHQLITTGPLKDLTASASNQHEYGQYPTSVHLSPIRTAERQ